MPTSAINPGISVTATVVLGSPGTSACSVTGWCGFAVTIVVEATALVGAAVIAGLSRFGTVVSITTVRVVGDITGLRTARVQTSTHRGGVLQTTGKDKGLCPVAISIRVTIVVSARVPFIHLTVAIVVDAITNFLRCWLDRAAVVIAVCLVGNPTCRLQACTSCCTVGL